MATHVYSAAGTYTVTVTVTDTGGLASTATATVKVLPPPDAPPNPVLGVNPSSGQAPLNVTADGSGSTDSDSTPIASYKFNFGDGTVVGPQAGATATHSYTAAGTYTVTLTVTDTGGLSSTATTQVTVDPQVVPPAAALTVNPGSGTAPLTVTADGSGSRAGSSAIASYRFDFGDGTIVGPQPGATATHTYSAGGTFTVTLTVADTDGTSSTATTQVTVNAPDLPPAPALVLDQSSGPAPLPVTADASGSTDTDQTPIATYKFDFGDGTVAGPQSSPTASHTYTRGGSYTVKVTVTDTGGRSSTATAGVLVFAEYIANGGFETDLSGWNTSGGGTGIALARVAGGHSGGWSAQATNSGTAPSTCLLNDSPNAVLTTAADGSYTASLWVRADSPGATLKLRVREYAGATFAGSADTDVALTTTWQQVSVVYTPAAPGGSSLDFNAMVINAAPGTCFYADDASLQLGPKVPPPPPDPNLVSNRGFESSLSGWNTSGSGTGIVLSRVAGGHSGDWAAQLANTGSAPATCALNDAPNVVGTTSAGTYTSSLWVRADTPGATLKLRVREYSGATLMGTSSSEVVLTTAWQQVTVAYAPAAPGASTLDLNAYVVGAPPGTCFSADDASITLG
jgi:PKD repeat protein